MEDYRYDHDHEYDDDDTTMSHADAADTSSHHGHDDDVFSDNNSPRSSMGSVSEGDPRKAAHDGMRSPRISDIQQQYDEPRSSLRSASSSAAGKAAQHAASASSPAPSVSGAGQQPQPRSGRRSALPTVSRLGSPNLSTQYSPKKTPPRFKKNDPPLVLLHVTLLPLRWCWGDVLDDAKTSELSEGVKTLREAWRQLQDTIGDTIQDRGVLLPHPQDDFEAMEERLLEALELPFKRRARILECGHYLGPSNEMPFADEEEEDDVDVDPYDEDAPPRPPVPEKQTHWCSTCHCEIRFDALGAGKIYRVKVYASNGLLRAGAWEACWKEMERVDIEIEPMMDAKLQDELVRLAARQDRVIHSKSRAGRRPLSSRVQDVEDERESEEDLDDPAVGDDTMGHESFMPQDGSTPRTSFEGYGDSYRTKSRQASGRASRGGRPSTGFAQTDAFGQHKKAQRRFAAGSFPDMVVNAFKALLDDKRNLAILLLSVLTVAVAVRGGVNNPFYDDIAAFQPPILTEPNETPTTVVSEAIGEDGQVQVEVGIESDGDDVSFSPTSAVVEILLTPQAKADGENPCAAMEPQTVEKWLTATVTERTTVARTDMPEADDDLFGSKDGDEEVDDDGSFEGAKDADGVHYLDGLPGEEDAGEQQQQQTHGQSDWEWGSRFKFPW
ncbi:hypothetical protein V8C26DRAFT_401527 [Trichoderma gracile]